MTINEFLKLWEQCEFKEYLREKCHISLDEYEQIKYDLRMMKWDRFWDEFVYDEFMNYLKKGNLAAATLNERLKIDTFAFKEILKNGEILEELREFWSKSIR